MLSLRHQRWFCFSLFLCSLWLSSACLQLAWTQDADSEKDKANKLVNQALDAELQGRGDQRNELLAAAINADPSNQLARWSKGQVLLKKKGAQAKWVPIQQFEKNAATDPKLVEYAKLRLSRNNDLKGNEAIAEWCRRNGVERVYQQGLKFMGKENGKPEHMVCPNEELGENYI